MRRFIIPGVDPYKLWTPTRSTESELDALPRCMRCSKRLRKSTAIEACWIDDGGDNRIDVVGRCRGTCDDPANGEPTEHPNKNGHDNWHDAVRITWEKFSDGRTDEMLGRDLVKQISAIRFFDDLQEVA